MTHLVAGRLVEERSVTGFVCANCRNIGTVLNFWISEPVSDEDRLEVDWFQLSFTVSERRDTLSAPDLTRTGS